MGRSHWENKQLYPNVKTIQSVNTNNGWGFGGWLGTCVTLVDGSIGKIGISSTRHLGTYEDNTFKNPNGDRITKKEFYERASKAAI